MSSRGDAVRTRRLLQSEWYHDRRGGQFTLSSDQNVKGFFTNDKGGWRFATSMRGAATGYDAHAVVVDDPHLVSQAESDLEREAVLTSWREVFPSRVLPGGCRVVIGQRVHEDCHSYLGGAPARTHTPRGFRPRP
jgi:hypothetical protein